jgi:uncharacterized Ntn-hydrolase superfamily protein
MLLNQLGEAFAAAGNTRAAEQCFDKARDAHELSADDLLAHGSIEPGRAAGGQRAAREAIAWLGAR